MPRKKSVDQIMEDYAERRFLYRYLILVLADQHIVVEASEKASEVSVAKLLGLQMAMARIVMLLGKEDTSQERVTELMHQIWELFEDDAFRAEVAHGIENKDSDSMGYMTRISEKILALAKNTHLI